MTGSCLWGEEEEEQSESLIIRANAEKLTSLLANA